MRLHAAITLPERIQADLTTAVRSVPGGPEELEPTPTPMLHLPLANFGNVSHASAAELQQTLTSTLAGLPPLHLRLHGGTALEEPGDDAVWAYLSGDIEQLLQTAFDLARAVHRLGFLVDHRRVYPRVRVARITGSTTALYLQRLLDRLTTYTGPEWTSTDVALLRPHATDPDAADSRFDVLYRIPLRRHDA